ncbi:unnamed protein product, partial [Oppiella nova]
MVTVRSEMDVLDVLNQTNANSAKPESIETNSVIKDNTLNSDQNNVISYTNGYGLDICNTSACERAGSIMKQSINESVDPCDDFYAFACGGWEATHTIPADKSRYMSFDVVDDQLKKDIKEYLSQNTSESDSNAVIYASDFYKACIDEATINARGVSPLITALNSIGGWPLRGQTGLDIGSDYDWKDSFAKVIVNFVSIQPDANDTLVNRFYFDSSLFGLGRNQLVNTSGYPDIVNAYKQYILESALLLGAQNDSQTHQDIEDL